jgi:nicotinamide-nucleotide amidase
MGHSRHATFRLTHSGFFERSNENFIPQIPHRMNAEIIAVGSELLTPDRLDTNSLFLTGRLSLLGIRVSRKAIVGDQPGDIRDAFSEALHRADVVISTGGLGPTLDDLTREAVAGLLGLALQTDEATLQRIRERFQRTGRAMPENNIRQAMVPEGAEILSNTRGTAPGLWLETRGRIIILLPGPPDEMEAIFEHEVERRLARRSAGLRLVKREIRVTGLPESRLEELIAPIYTGYADVETTILAGQGEIQIHPRMWSADAEAARRTLDELTSKIESALGEHIFSSHGEAFENVVAAALVANHATIATAESCTGGLLAERLTRVPGSSAYFVGGVVCYSDESKTAFAGVPGETINTHGSVSAEVAVALAEGIRRRSGAMMGVGITGVAGPGGGTPEKPAGTVHIALASEKQRRESRFLFPGDRERVRWQASQVALDWVRRHFLPGARGGN